MTPASRAPFADTRPARTKSLPLPGPPADVSTGRGQPGEFMTSARRVGLPDKRHEQHTAHLVDRGEGPRDLSALPQLGLVAVQDRQADIDRGDALHQRVLN